jgi:resuscitation-promoting factor RpfB
VVVRTADPRVHGEPQTLPVTYQPPSPIWPGQPPRKQGFWQRLSPWQRVGLIAAALVLPCCGGVTAIGALAGDDAKTVTSSSNLADVEPLATTENAPTTEAAPPSEAASTSEAAPTEDVTEEAAPVQPTPTTPAAVKKTVTATVKIAYKTKRVEDDSLAEGRTRVRTKGVNGVKTITYEVTTVDGKQTARRVVSTEITRKPVTKVIAVGTKVAAPADDCDPNYSPCVPIASDVDCAGGSGNGPAYVRGPVTVIGSDIYDLDRDGDGTACDS